MYKILYNILLLSGPVFATDKLQDQFHWKILDYSFPDHLTKERAIISGNFIPENNLPVGIEAWKDKLFVTVPRWREGIPSTLNYIQLHDLQESPPLIPYPDWVSNEDGNCKSGLTTVYRIKADSCNRLWVLDTGTFGIGNTTIQLCPYALNIFDLLTNTRIRRYQLRDEDINTNTFIANIAVDIGTSCKDTFAYLSDELGYGLITYSWEQDKSWRFEHSFFMPDPLASDFNIGGLNFQWGEEGIFGMSLTPIQKDGFRRLYFSPLASNREFVVSTQTLRNSSKVGNSYRDFQALEERGPLTHTTARVMDENGLQLFNLIDQNAIGCWNSENTYNSQNIDVVDKDDEALIFPSDIKIDGNSNVWVISDKMSTFLLSNLDYNEINFRIFAAPLHDLVENSVCRSNIRMQLYQTIAINHLGFPLYTLQHNF